MHFQQPHNENSQESRAKFFLHGVAPAARLLLSTIAVDNPVHTLVSVGVSKVPVWEFAPAVNF
jgi:hypothetical protein